ncbi:hypothetical protein AEQ67_26215 [Pseudomonas sp. RIT-PI-q]|nr:hypothetical protein AEQ67_26215 [Pseudomonas sp. RIT-PI-q]
MQAVKLLSRSSFVPTGVLQLPVARFSFDQVIDVLAGGVVQGFILAGRCQESFHLFLCVRVKACDVVGFIKL